MEPTSSFAADCLAGRLVLITGGSGALGVAMIAALARHGATVANADIAEPQEAGPARFYRCDGTQEDQVVGMAKHQWETEPLWRARAEKAIPLGVLQDPQSMADARCSFARTRAIT